jgi:hypothetical protein
MNEMEIIQPQEENGAEAVEEAITETVEAEQVEQAAEAEQSLEDATYDAGAHVEQSGNFEQAEQAETTLTTVVDEIVDAADQVSAQTSTRGQEVDPVTGESKPSGGATGGETEAAQADEEILQVEPVEKDAQMDAAVDRVATEAKSTLPDDDAVVNVVEPSEETPATEGEKTTLPVEDGVAAPTAEATHDVEAQALGPEKLPETRKMPVGMGKNGALFPAGAGVKTGGSMPAGGKTSGGGAPVGNYGSGSRGTKWGGTMSGTSGYFSGTSKTSCESTKDRVEDLAKISGGSGDISVVCDNGDWYSITWDENGVQTMLYFKGMTLDGVTPMPYTGNWSWGPTDLSHKPSEGPDREASFLQMVHASQDTESNQVGYGSSGDSTFSPDGGGDGDDSGKFYGGLEGSAVRPNNPDEPDYYTPNVLSEALAKMDMR